LKHNASGKPTYERAFITENLTQRNKHLFSLSNEENNFDWKYIWTNKEEFISEKAMTAK